MGMVAILHTWGQNLSLHPHLHCIVPGGGLNAKGAEKSNDAYACRVYQKVCSAYSAKRLC